MAGSTAPEAPGWPTPGVFDTRAGFQQAVHGLLLGLQARGVRRLLWATDDALLWPLEEAVLLEALTAWVRQPGHQWIWLGRDLELLRARRPRLTRWRQTWDHQLRCWAPADPEVPASRHLLIAEGHGLLELLDPAHWRGRFSELPADIRHACEWFDAVLQRSTATFAVTTLGI